MENTGMSTEKWGDSVEMTWQPTLRQNASSEPKDQVVVDWLGDLQ